MFTHSPRTNLLSGSPPHSPSAKPSGNRYTIAAVLKRGIHLHVHSPRTSLHAGSPPQRAHNPSVKPSGHLDTIATVMKREIHLHVHSPRTSLHAGSPPHRAHNPSVKAIRTSGHNSYSNEKRNRFACSLTHLEQISTVVLHSTAGQQSHQEIGTQ